MPIANKRRSRRLRKKLHIGEFKELGFEFKAELSMSLSFEEEATLIDRFLVEVIEPRGLALGGRLTSGFICRYARGSVSSEDQEQIKNWLQSIPAIKAVTVGPLVDAWYS